MARTKNASRSSSPRLSPPLASALQSKVAKMRSQTHAPKMPRHAPARSASPEPEVEFTNVPPGPVPTLAALPRRVYSDSELAERELLRPMLGGALCRLCYNDVVLLEDRSSLYCVNHQPSPPSPLLPL